MNTYVTEDKTKGPEKGGVVGRSGSCSRAWTWELAEPVTEDT